ncbi:MAG: GntP family permease [Burkholderiales bacterium]|nr:GntP family permease [Phycisphaerae bacterium]
MAAHWVLLAGIVMVVGGILVLRLHAFLALVLGAMLVAALTSPAQLEQYAKGKKLTEKETKQLVQAHPAARVTKEFGSTAGRIGILIALASIVGKCVMDSGAADRIVRSTVKILGEGRAAWSFLVSGYLLGIPIFFDTVFLLMVPLAKAMWNRTRKNYALYIMATISGGSMTQYLVPPTPGPLAVATELKIDLGMMILMGCVVGALTALVGMAYAFWMDARMNLTPPAADVAAAANEVDESQLPGLMVSLAPILLPVLFIGGATVVSSAYSTQDVAAMSGGAQSVIGAINFLGDANVSLAIAAGVALLTWLMKKRPDQKQVNHAMSDALADGGQILLLTAAGGAFGGVLQQTGIGDTIKEFVQGSTTGILPIAFVLTMLVRAAQGSATVAMMTTVGMFAALATPEQLGYHPVYLALAIGCGSKPLAWMNDSGFWTIGKTSGMTETETLKTFTAQTSIEALAGLLILMGMSAVLPLV